ncbi:hypothetical protein EDD17DRAFT_1672269 [Pisolithus thermaeus]|nr:hypothetical protein EDD17DRAFT_1672269 [Pisolithus thermaeus]
MPFMAFQKTKLAVKAVALELLSYLCVVVICISLHGDYNQGNECATIRIGNIASVFTGPGVISTSSAEWPTS